MKKVTLFIAMYLFLGFFEKAIPMFGQLQIYSGVLAILSSLFFFDIKKRQKYFGFLFLLFLLVSFYINKSNIHTQYIDYKFVALNFVVIVAFFSGALFIERPNSIDYFLKWVFYFSSFIAIIGFITLLLNFQSKRLIVFEGNPIGLARAAGLCFIINYYYWLLNKKKLNLVLIFVCIPVIFFTQSMGPTIALISVLMTYAIIKHTNKKIVLKIITLLVALLVSIYIYSREIFFSLDGRDELYKKAIDYIEKKPEGYWLGFYSTLGYVNYPHNIILEMLLELGYLFTIIFILFLLYAFYKAYSKNFYLLKNKRNLIISTLLLYFFICSMVSGDLISPNFFYILMFYFLMYKNIRNKDPEYETSFYKAG